MLNLDAVGVRITIKIGNSKISIQENYARRMVATSFSGFFARKEKADSLT
ncbi:hypothetical protein [Flavobacterium segetis]|nr:hypothetical protein [Flavobacterium segetis]